MRGARRLQVANFLINTRADAVTWRRKEAARIKKFGDKNPPILPSNEVVRKAKEQRLLDKYGLSWKRATKGGERGYRVNMDSWNKMKAYAERRYRKTSEEKQAS